MLYVSIYKPNMTVITIHGNDKRGKGYLPTCTGSRGRLPVSRFWAVSLRSEVTMQQVSRVTHYLRHTTVARGRHVYAGILKVVQGLAFYGWQGQEYLNNWIISFSTIADSTYVSHPFS